MKFLNKKLTTCVISAGGEGTRLKSITNGVPKPLFPIDGKSCLERSIDKIQGFGLKNIFILTCYKKNLIIDAIKKYNNNKDLNIKVIEEIFPLGECGGLWLLKNELRDEIFFINADLVWDIDIKRFLNFHVEHKSEVTFLTHTCTHPKDSDLISEGINKQIVNYSLKPHKDLLQEMFLGNSGIALFNSNILDKIDNPVNKPSFCNHILNNFEKSNVKVFSYNTTEFVKDVGTPKRFYEVEKTLKQGLVNPKSYINKQKCLFIDRDNTIISCPKDKYITNKNQVKLLEKNIIKIARKTKEYDFTIIVTNQPQISMGLVSWDDVIEINSLIIQECLNLGLKIDGFTLCPHHENLGFEGEIRLLKQDCFCRKPRPGMFLKEAYYRNIDLKKSLMIGDSEIDKVASARAGCSYLDVKKL